MMRFTANRNAIVLAAAITASAFIAGVAVGLSHREESTETASVVVYDGSDRALAIETPSRAIQTLEEAIGFRPAVPESLPFDGLQFVAVRSVLPPLVERGAERSHLVYASHATEPEALVIVAQSPVFWGSDLDGQTNVEIGISGAQAWRIGEPQTRGPEYWLESGDQWVYVLTGAPNAVSDEQARPMLRSIAEQLIDPS